MTTYIQTNQIQPQLQHRVLYVDIAKGLGMLAIIWGHIMLSGWSYYLVYSFHIPLFFFLSGMMFDGNKYIDLWSLVKRRAKTLLLPYLMFSFLTWCLWAGMNIVTHTGANIWAPLLQTFIAQGSGGFMVHNVPLWFVTCLFVVEVLYFFLKKLPDWANIIICILCALVGDYMIRGGHLSFFRLLPWNFEGAMSALLFYSFGNLLLKHCSHEKLVGVVESNKVLSIFMVVGFTVILLLSANWNGHITIGSNSLGRNTLVFYANALIGIVSTIAFSVLISFLSPNNVIKKWPLSFIKWFGKNSFLVMATHVPVKGIILMLVSKCVHTSPSGVSNSFVLSLVAFVLTLCIDSVIVLLAAKMKEHDEAMVNRRKALK